MRTRSTLILLGLLGCTRASSGSDPLTNPAPGARPAPATPALKVQMIAVTLGDDCGTAGLTAPSTEDQARRADADSEADRDDWVSPCEQTSMQLAIIGAPSGAPQSVRVKRVELFDDKGTLIGELTSRNPTVWSPNGTYGAWDQKVAPNQELSVSYALSAPNWTKIGKRYDRNYTLKAVLTLDATDREVKRDVQIDAPAPMPAMVDT